MPAGWYKRSDGKIEDDSNRIDEVEFKPEELKKDIAKDVEDRFTKFGSEIDDKLKPIAEMAAAIKSEREEKIRVAKEAAERKAAEDDKVDEIDFLTDPAGAMDKKLRGTNTMLAMLAAKQTKSETLAEKEYYHGEIKDKVDAMIAAQPLRNQVDPTVVLNCYKLVMFDNQKEITEGKIKSKNAAMTFEGGSTGGHSGDDKSTNETMSNEEKNAAKLLGLTEKDWIASRKEMEYV